MSKGTADGKLIELRELLEAEAVEAGVGKTDGGRLKGTVAPTDVPPELVTQLARQLSVENGEDPDEQPYPSRFPRWRYYYARAKKLLAITPAEHRAVAIVLGVHGKPLSGTDDLSASGGNTAA